MINVAERIDDLKLNNLKIIQDTGGFCFGIDAVLLSYIAENPNLKSYMDLCSGNGIVPILLAGKTNAEKIVAVEIQEKQAMLAKRSVELNGLEDRIYVYNMDLKNVPDVFEKASFDAVTCNPPYMKCDKGIINGRGDKAIARHEIMCTLEDVISVSAEVLKPKGNFYMVHRPKRLVDIFCIMRKYKIEPKKMWMVHPSKDKKANIVLIEGLKNGGEDLKMMEPIYVYDNVGNYTDTINRIYRRDGR